MMAVAILLCPGFVNALAIINGVDCIPIRGLSTLYSVFRSVRYIAQTITLCRAHQKITGKMPLGAKHRNIPGSA